MLITSFSQNQSCWLEDQQSIRRDADAIYRDYLEYSDAEASRRYHNFVTLVDEAEEEIAISRRDLFPILKTSPSSHQLVYTQILSSLLPGAQSLNMFRIETDLMSEAKFKFVAEQIDELHRLGATGLAKAMQESLVTTIALLVDTSPLRLQREADKLNQLDAEFSSAICEELDGFGFSPVPLLLRAPNLVDCRIIQAIMVQCKQEPTMTDSIGRSALHIALERPRTAKKVLASHDRIQRILLTHDDCQIVKALLDWGVPLGIRDIFGRTALHLASFYSWSLKAIQLLTEASDHDIDAKDVVGHTAFSWAVKKSNMELAKQLLATGEVDVNTKDKYGYTPLYFAVKASDVSMVRMLLARDDIAPSIDIQGELDPLTCAWNKWDMEILSMFSRRIHHGINDNVVAPQHSTEWRSLLSMAATEGKVHAVKFLLAVDGIDASSKSRSGMTALDWARKKGHAETVALLEDHERRLKKVQEEGFGGKEKDDEAQGQACQQSAAGTS